MHSPSLASAGRSTSAAAAASGPALDHTSTPSSDGLAGVVAATTALSMSTAPGVSS